MGVFNLEVLSESIEMYIILISVLAATLMVILMGNWFAIYICTWLRRLSSERNREQTIESDSCAVTYGQLVVLGYNGLKPSRAGRELSLVLRKKPKAEGQVMVSRSITRGTNIRLNETFVSSLKKTMAFIMNEQVTEVVEYDNNYNSDRFQIGRLEPCPEIDLTVDKTKMEFNELTISRVACRIEVQRQHPYEARVYAGGFDQSGNILLNENARKFKQIDGLMDGFTTCGIFVWHADQREWGEVSVNGNVFKVDGKKLEKSKVTNVLRDGSLIDLNGTTLLFRTEEGLSRSPTKEMLCMLKTKLKMTPMELYVACGHVVKRDYDSDFDCLHVDNESCPVCSIQSSVTMLSIGFEPSICVNIQNPDHAFVPCGHMASRATVQYWASIRYPQKECPWARCPFCMILLHSQMPYSYIKETFSQKRRKQSKKNTVLSETVGQADYRKTYQKVHFSRKL